MILGGSGTRFALESLDAIGIGGQVMPQHLDRHDAPKPPVARAVDLAHAAGAERIEDFVRSEACAGIKCHGSRRKGTRPNRSQRTSVSRVRRICERELLTSHQRPVGRLMTPGSGSPKMNRPSASLVYCWRHCLRIADLHR
jgi:hypothetical protein